VLDIAASIVCGANPYQILKVENYDSNAGIYFRRVRERGNNENVENCKE
jgi:hypothetical protein